MRIPVDTTTSPEIAKRRTRAWIEASVPSEWIALARGGEIEELRRKRTPEAYRAWYPVYAASGLVAPEWPVACGGLGVDRPTSRAISEELAAVGLVRLNPVGLGLAGPTILDWGSPSQADRYLPAIVTAEEIWCQLFSEPGAGSDLAGLSTRASRDGETWVISGQKVWSSFAHEARRGLLLARTDPAAPKREGISYFLLDIAAPGVEVRPLRQLTGDCEFNEVFLDEVRVPADCMLGPEGKGWEVARTTLLHERHMLAGVGSGLRERTSGRSVDRVLDALRASSQARNPTLRERAAQAYIEAQVLRFTNLRAAAARARGPVGPEGSVTKLFQTEHNKRLQSLLVDITGMPVIAHQEPAEMGLRSTIYGFLRSLSGTIAGGTSEIQRNMLAERILGLPREDVGDSSVPWDQIARNG